MSDPLEYAGPIKKGDTFGAREVLGCPFLVRRKAESRAAFVVCRCKCGAVDVLRTDQLGRCCRSCKNVSKRRGGNSRLRICQTWYSMINRCHSESAENYSDYGGRGIFVCSEWRDDFDEFMAWAYSNGYDDSLTIERKDVNGNYEPSNCE